MTLEARLAGLSRKAARAGIFSDFDGVLAPIVPDPEQARPLRGAQPVMARLAQRFGLVAVVTGRDLESLRRRWRAPGVMQVGLHGMEVRHGRRLVVQPEARAARPAVERAIARLRAEVGAIDGVTIEHKGWAAAVHFRRARDPAGAQDAAAPAVASIAAAEGLVVKPGRRILEIVPLHARTKGDAIRALIVEHGLEAALVIGDDLGDVPAFEAVSALATHLRVAVVSDESPPALAKAADHTVWGPSEAVALLRRLAG